MWRNNWRSLQMQESAFPFHLTSWLIWWMWHNCVFSSLLFSKTLLPRKSYAPYFHWKDTPGMRMFNTFVGFVRETKLSLSDWCCWHCQSCNWKTRAASAQSFTLWQQATIEITCHNHSYCLFVPHTVCMGVVLCAHPVCGEPHIQHYAKREVATTSPHFYNELHWSHILFYEDWTWHDLHILVTAPFCCDRKARAVSVQSVTLWQQATIEITWQDHSIIAFSHHIYMVVILCAYPVCGKSHIPRNVNWEVATPVKLFFDLESSAFNTLRAGVQYIHTWKSA